MSKSQKLGIFFLSLIVIAFIGSTFLFFYQRPYLSSLSASEISVGETVVLEGHNLGDLQSSTLMVGGYEVLPRFVKEWNPSRITFTLSENMSSGLIFVKSGFLQSNSLFFINRSQVPDFSLKNGTGAYLLSLGVDKLVPTTEVVLKGRFLGIPSGERSLVFQSLEGQRKEIRLLEEDIISWTDSEIHFIVPIGLSSGRLYLEDQGTKSNALPYIIEEQTARWDVVAEKRHNFKVLVTLERRTPEGDETFYFWFPEPRGAFNLEQGAGTGALSSYPMAGGRVYQISASSILFITLEETYSLNSSSVQVILNPDLVRAYPRNSKLVAENTKVSTLWENNANLGELINSFKIPVLTNPYSYARSIFDRFLEEFTVTDEDTNLTTLSVENKVLSSAQLNTLFVDSLKSAGLPAREVLGIYQDNRSVYHLWQWAELYLEGIGWTPIDIGLSAGSRDPYWLQLSENHISLASVPSKQNPITLQGEMLSLKTIGEKEVLLAGRPWLYENIKKRGELLLSNVQIDPLSP